jgi:hypothetical protein
MGVIMADSDEMRINNAQSALDKMIKGEYPGPHVATIQRNLEPVDYDTLRLKDGKERSAEEIQKEIRKLADKGHVKFANKALQKLEDKVAGKGKGDTGLILNDIKTELRDGHANEAALAKHGESAEEMAKKLKVLANKGFVQDLDALKEKGGIGKNTLQARSMLKQIGDGEGLSDEEKKKVTLAKLAINYHSEGKSQGTSIPHAPKEHGAGIGRH